MNGRIQFRGGQDPPPARRPPSKELSGSVAARCVLTVTLLVVAGGCSESLQQYTLLGDWRDRSADDTPLVLSGSSERDTAAYSESSKELSAADWRVLEEVAPRPVWERIERTRRQNPAAAVTTETDSDTAEGVDRLELPPLPDIPTETLAGGLVQIYYELQHYGGNEAHSIANGNTSRRTITLQPGDLKPVAAMISQRLGDKGECSAVPDQNSLVITCDPTVKDQALRLLAHVDVPERQVEITARIFEVSNDFDFQLGAKTLISHIASDNQQALASSFSAADFVGAVVNPATGNVPDPGAALRLMTAFTDAGLAFDVMFQALADTGLIKVVSSPRMTTQAGQTAYMLAGQELPVQSAMIANDQVITQSTEYKPVGVQLYVTPQVVGRDSVKLHVLTMVTAISGFAPLPSLDRSQATRRVTNPILDSREAETNVSVGDGETLVIGGLRTTRTVTREQKIPGLGDLWGAGWLFRNARSQRQINDLYFFVTPRILTVEAE